MKFISAVQSLFGKKADDIIGTVADTVDRFVTTGEERHQWDLVMRELDFQIRLKFKEIDVELHQLFQKDRESARATFERKGFLHTVFALSFLVGYFVITGGLIWFVWTLVMGALGNPEAAQVVAEIPAWAATLLGGIFSAMSSKINTIIDFLFGGSDTKDTSEIMVNEALQEQSRRNDVRAELDD